jgi:2-polyprenyl-3-methyl-5-hydroxy-6-metoxy-1,4-benzoquinol methylase
MNLAVRSTLPERMDSDCADYEDYRRCLRDLSRVNVATLTHRPMLAWLGRQTAGMTEFSLLDVACGHGDALRRIAAWARRRGLTPHLTGIDLNPWAIRAATEATVDPCIRYIHSDVFAWQPDPRPDFIVSAQFTHHLTGPEIVRFLLWMDATAAKGWFIGDLHRHWFPYLGFPLLARTMLWHRFIGHDGQISIARSFRTADWNAMLAEAGVEASVTWRFPFRICVAAPA